MRYPMLRSLGELCSMALSALLLAAMALFLAGCGGSFGVKSLGSTANGETVAALNLSLDPGRNGCQSHPFEI